MKIIVTGVSSQDLCGLHTFLMANLLGGFGRTFSLLFFLGLYGLKPLSRFKVRLVSVLALWSIPFNSGLHLYFPINERELPYLWKQICLTLCVKDICVIFSFLLGSISCQFVWQLKGET